jgi:hypothetical protein
MKGYSFFFFCFLTTMASNADELERLSMGVLTGSCMIIWMRVLQAGIKNAPGMKLFF